MPFFAEGHLYFQPGRWVNKQLTKATPGGNQILMYPFVYSSHNLKQEYCNSKSC